MPRMYGDVFSLGTDAITIIVPATLTPFHSVTQLSNYTTGDKMSSSNVAPLKLASEGIQCVAPYN